MQLYFGLLLALTLVVNACTSPSPSVLEDQKPSSLVIPDSPAGHQLSWILDVLNNRQGKVQEGEVVAHFHQDFLSKMPVTQTENILLQLGGQMSPLTLKSIENDPVKSVVIGHTTTKAENIRIVVSVDPKTGTMNGLFFQPDQVPGPKLNSYSEVEKALSDLAPKVHFLVAEWDHGSCTTVAQFHAKEPLAIGSAFKLYVLLGLTQQIEAKKLSWDQELAVREEWKSLPSGTMQDESAGKKFPIRTFAEHMIEISDNTATDHLLYTVGRKQVETALTLARSEHAALNKPFPSTREMFLLKQPDAFDQRAAYLAKIAAARRIFLDHDLAGKRPSLEAFKAWKKPMRIHELEWFASAMDMCRVMGTFVDRAPALEILAKNPGMPVDKHIFPYVGFKGGSEPGVMDLTWLLRRQDGRWFIVTLAANDATEELDEGKVIGVASGLLELFSKNK